MNRIDPFIFRINAVFAVIRVKLADLDQGLDHHFIGVDSFPGSGAVCFQSVADNFHKNRFFAFGNQFGNITADIVIQNNFSVDTGMRFQEGLGSVAAFFFIGRKDNPEFERQIILENIFHGI